jgi:voltage-gated potassium channel
MLFFGTIVATATAYFMRLLKQIIDTIEYNLEQLDRLSIEEPEMLKDTTDALIEHAERLRLKQAEKTDGYLTGLEFVYGRFC